MGEQQSRFGRYGVGKASVAEVELERKYGYWSNGFMTQMDSKCSSSAQKSQTLGPELQIGTSAYVPSRRIEFTLS